METLTKLIKAELPDYTGLSRQRIYMLDSEGKLPPPDELTEVRREPLWPTGTIDAWMAATGRVKKAADK